MPEEAIKEKNSEEKDLELKDAVEKRRIWLLINGIFLVICLALAVVIFFFITKSKTIKESGALSGLITDSGQAGQADEEKTVEENKPVLVRRMIDGVMVESGKENFIPVAVMIENHVDSRPPSSLSKANLVYEALAEGSITRFMAIFANGDNLEKIGPVRSARPYYVDWAEEYGAVYSHCGGSPDALAQIIADDVPDMNEFYNAKFFWREKSRPAPHNVYTSAEKINGFIEKKAVATSTYEPWLFKDDADISVRPEIASTTVNFKGKDFIVKWVYNKESNDYTRFLGGKEHADEDGSIIKAKNIAIQKVAAEVVDEKARLKIKTIGFGKAIVCMDGACQDAIWKKSGEKSRTRFYFKADNGTGEDQSTTMLEKEVEFNAGTTWVEVVPPTYKIEY